MVKVYRENKTYRTSEIADMFGIHVNTVRLYENCGLIPTPQRLSNGYRVFTELHVEQFKLARAALQVEVLQNGLRRQAVRVIKRSAAGEYEQAEKLIECYLEQLEREMKQAEEAIEITRDLLADSGEAAATSSKVCCNSSERSDCSRADIESVFTRKEAAEYLHVTIDTLRNWELNGLFTIKRRENGYRIYTESDLQQLKIIRSLRCANYSLSSILRMLKAVSADPGVNLRRAIDTPEQGDDIIAACDKLLTSLREAKRNALFVASQIKKIAKMARDGQREHVPQENIPQENA